MTTGNEPLAYTGSPASVTHKGSTQYATKAQALAATANNVAITPSSLQNELAYNTGSATLVAGTVTVTNAKIKSTSKIFVSRVAANASTTLGELSYTISANTSFTINSLILGTPGSVQTADVSSVAYFIVY